MTTISSLISLISTWLGGLGGKVAAIAIGAALLIAAVAGAYLYIHGKNQALAKAEAALTLAQSELSSAVAANGADQQTIAALRAQQVQTAAAEAAMNARDQISQNSAAAIQKLIDGEAAVCPAVPLPPSGVGVKAPVAVSKDGPAAAVLTDALAALASAQAGQGAAP